MARRITKYSLTLCLFDPTTVLTGFKMVVGDEISCEPTNLPLNQLFVPDDPIGTALISSIARISLPAKSEGCDWLIKDSNHHEERGERH